VLATRAFDRRVEDRLMAHVQAVEVSQRNDRTWMRAQAVEIADYFHRRP
jgi:hypothetical protein